MGGPFLVNDLLLTLGQLDTKPGHRVYPYAAEQDGSTSVLSLLTSIKIIPHAKVSSGSARSIAGAPTTPTTTSPAPAAPTPAPAAPTPAPAAPTLIFSDLYSYLSTTSYGQIQSDLNDAQKSLNIKQIADPVEGGFVLLEKATGLTLHTTAPNGAPIYPMILMIGGPRGGTGSASAPKRTLTPNQVTKGMEINPADVNIYRGGNSLNARVGVDIQIDKATGLVKPTHGLSLDIDAGAMQKFGGAYQVESIPAELNVIQRGSRIGHFEIVPRQSMTPEKFQELANQIVLKPAGG